MFELNEGIYKFYVYILTKEKQFYIPELLEIYIKDYISMYIKLIQVVLLQNIMSVS